MFDIKTKRFEFSQEMVLKPNQRESERKFKILKIVKLIINSKLYFLVLYDDSMISIYQEKNLKIIKEFKIRSYFNHQTIL
jgi:hypothetical protein